MTWESAKPDLMTIIKKLNEKHKSMKFDFRISPRKIPFFDKMLFKDLNKNIQTNLNRKRTDGKTFSHTKAEHSKSYNFVISIFFLLPT